MSNPLEFWLMAFCSAIFVTNVVIEILDRDTDKGEKLFRFLVDLVLLGLMALVFVSILTKR